MASKNNKQKPEENNLNTSKETDLGGLSSTSTRRGSLLFQKMEHDEENGYFRKRSKNILFVARVYLF